MTDVYTIGFTKKPAEKFFSLLIDSGAGRVVDVRINNVSQLAGFAKKDDLAYFLDAICGMEYVHAPELAPTQEMVAAYRKDRKTWPEFRAKFLELMEERQVEKTTPRELIEGSCLLCSEDEPDGCHRLLVAEYLNEKWGGDLTIHHLR